MRYFRRALYFVAGLYLLAALALYLVQGKMIYFPDGRDLADCELPQGVQFWSEGGEQGSLSSSGHSNLLLFFHGNGDSACGWRYLGVNHLARLGFDVLVLEYPGYGGDLRDPSKPLIEASLNVVDNWVRGQSYNSVSVMGFSLGSGVASVYARDFGVDRIVLFAPFDSVYKVALHQGLYFPRFLLREGFDNIAALSDVTAPITILHGLADVVIPQTHSQNLYVRLLSLGRMVRRDTVIGAGHNGLFEAPHFDLYMEKVLTSP